MSAGFGCLPNHVFRIASRTCEPTPRRMQLRLRMAGANIGDEIDDLVWRNRAHNPRFDWLLSHEVLRQVLHQPRVIVNQLKMGTDQVAKIREVYRLALAAKKRPSKLLFEKLDGARQRGLRHIALLACAGEIQLLGHREEITNLVHLHGSLTDIVDGHGRIAPVGVGRMKNLD